MKSQAPKRTILAIDFVALKLYKVERCLETTKIKGTKTMLPVPRQNVIQSFICQDRVVFEVMQEFSACLSLPPYFEDVLGNQSTKLGNQNRTV